MGLARRAGWIGCLGPLIVTLAILGGCTTRTAGMQAPLAHDYEPLLWRPLDSGVAQEITVAPGYTALVENDASTDAAALQSRIERLPEDVRQSRLVEIQIALRPADERTFDGESMVQVSRLSDGETLLSRRLIDLRFARDWAVLDDLAAVDAGEVLLIELQPASSATGWEYGYATGSIPYGGSGALLDPRGSQPVELGHALGFQTIFAQRTDAGEITGDGIRTALSGFSGDPVLLGAYGVLLLAGGGVAYAWSGRRPGGGRDGR